MITQGTFDKLYKELRDLIVAYQVRNNILNSEVTDLLIKVTIAKIVKQILELDPIVQNMLKEEYRTKSENPSSRKS